MSDCDMREACVKHVADAIAACYRRAWTSPDEMRGATGALKRLAVSMANLPLPHAPAASAPADDAVRPKCRCGCDDGMHDAGRPGTRRCKSPKCGCVDFQPPRPVPADDAVRAALRLLAAPYGTQEWREAGDALSRITAPNGLKAACHGECGTEPPGRCSTGCAPDERPAHDAVREARAVAEAAFDLMTDAERAVLPLNVQEDARRRVSLAHIESGEGAPAGQGTAVVSVPSKYARLAWAMVSALNALAAERAAPATDDAVARARERDAMERVIREAASVGLGIADRNSDAFNAALQRMGEALVALAAERAERDEKGGKRA